MPKILELDEIQRRLAEAEQALWKILDQSDVPLMLGGARPANECPRGHEYPANAKLWPRSSSNPGNRRCETCRLMAHQRKKLRSKIKNYERLMREYSYW
jgi:hypothetical protein